MYTRIKKRTIESSEVSYKETTVKDELDGLLIDTHEILEGGDATSNEIYPGKIGYSKGILIKGTMPDYGESAFTIDSIFRIDADEVGFHPTEEGYYSPLTTFTMTFGNQKTVNIGNDGYLSKTTTISVASSLIYMGLTFKGNNITVKNSSGESISSETIEYDATKQIKVAPKTGYYLSGVTCTNGYTTNANTGTSYYESQTITVSNNGNLNGTTCTVNMHSRSYAAPSTAATYHAAVAGHSHTSSCYSYSHTLESRGFMVGWRCTACEQETDAYSQSSGECPAKPAAGRKLVCGKSEGQGAVAAYYLCSTGTLVGDKCYTCPNGGTLSGTTCVF